MENIVVEQRKLQEVIETDRFDKTPVREYDMEEVRESFVESAAALLLANRIAKPDCAVQNENDDLFLPLHLSDGDIACTRGAV